VIAASSAADPVAASSTDPQVNSPQGTKRSIDEVGDVVGDATDSTNIRQKLPEVFREELRKRECTDEERHGNTRRNDSRERHYSSTPHHDRVDGGDYYIGGGRPRSRSPRRDCNDRNPGDVRDRSRDRRGGGHDGRRNARRSKTASPEATEESKDKRTKIWRIKSRWTN
jgi:RNA-binding protein 39